MLWFWDYMVKEPMRAPKVGDIEVAKFLKQRAVIGKT